MIKKHYLLSPGPTPLPEDVQAAGSLPLIHHRTSEFSQIFMDVTKGLQSVFQTSQDVYILTSSGTGAMEAAVVNILSSGDKVITINGGKFGSRWSAICRAYGIEVKEITLEWGETVAADQLEAKLKANPDTKAVFSTLHETATGTMFDIEGYGRISRDLETLLVVDGISGIGAAPCPMDEWGIDVLISGAQKSFMTPPGLAYIAFSDKAWKAVENAGLPRFYFDAVAAREALKRQTSAWTPAISLVRQQKAALDRIRKIGLDNLIAHHKIMGEAARAGVNALNLKLLSKHPGNVLTAVHVPKGIDGLRLVKIMHNTYRAYIAGAQAPHKGEFFRIGHLGYTGGFDIITALSALEMTLDELGYPVEMGASIGAAESILKENRS
jgi:serine---pyruvate transaminase